jgi:hypothetical protein
VLQVPGARPRRVYVSWSLASVSVKKGRESKAKGRPTVPDRVVRVIMVIMFLNKHAVRRDGEREEDRRCFL